MTDSGLALLFPGQGSQHLGMGKALAEAFPVARETFEEADDVLDFRLSTVIWEGPEEDLVLTRNAQPAILTHSVAVCRVMPPEILAGAVMGAGHSLGEFSAYVAAGALPFPQALRLVRRRGELMFEAGLSREGAMAAVLGLEDQEVESVCAEASQGEASVVVPANFNSPGQVVVSGDADAVDRARDLASERGAKKVVPLKVSGAFHSPLMQPAASGLDDELSGVDLVDPGFPVYSNVTTAAVRDASLARTLLVRQLTEPVRWRASVGAMVQAGAGSFLELGPGKVLAGLNKRNASGIPTRNVGEPADLEPFD